MSSPTYDKRKTGPLAGPFGAPVQRKDDGGGRRAGLRGLNYADGTAQLSPKTDGPGGPQALVQQKKTTEKQTKNWLPGDGSLGAIVADPGYGRDGLMRVKILGKERPSLDFRTDKEHAPDKNVSLRQIVGRGAGGHQPIYRRSDCGFDHDSYDERGPAREKTANGGCVFDPLQMLDHGVVDALDWFMGTDARFKDNLLPAIKEKLPDLSFDIPIIGDVDFEPYVVDAIVASRPLILELARTTNQGIQNGIDANGVMTISLREILEVARPALRKALRTLYSSWPPLVRLALDEFGNAVEWLEDEILGTIPDYTFRFNVLAALDLDFRVVEVDPLPQCGASTE